jgi:hypothetical protein
MLLLLPGFSLRADLQELTPLLLLYPHAPLPDHGVLPPVLLGLGGRFEPRPFSGLYFSANELLHTRWGMATSIPILLLF